MAGYILANELSEEISIVVDGHNHIGFQNIAMTSSINNLAGRASFSVVQRIDDRGFSRLDKLQEGQSCNITVSGQLALTGTIDKRVANLGLETYGVSLEIRSNTRNIVDSSHIDTVSEYINMKPSDIVKRVAKPFGIKVINLASNIEKPVAKFRYNAGTKALEIIHEVCRMQGITIHDNEHAQIVLTGLGNFDKAADSLEWWRNIKEPTTVTRDISNQFSEYRGQGMVAPTARNRGKSANQNTSIIKNNNETQYRPLVILGEGSMDSGALSKRVEHETSRRAGEGLEVSTVVAGWRANGKLWQPSTMSFVSIESEGVSKELLIKTVSRTQSPENGTETSLTLSPKESYTKSARVGKSVAKRSKSKKTNQPEFGTIDLSGFLR